MNASVVTEAKFVTLRGQLLRHILVPIIAVLVLGSLMTFAIARHISNEIHDQWLLDSAMALAQQLKMENGRVALDLPRAAMEMFHFDRVDRIYHEVKTETGSIVSSTTAFPELPGVPPDPGEHFYYDGQLDGQEVRVIALAFATSTKPPVITQVQVAETLHKRQAITEMIILFLAPVQIAIQILAGVFIWSAVTQNLSKVNDIAARLTGYDSENLLPLNDADSVPMEIKPLVSALNALILRLGDAQNNQRRFIANAAHQMRTPLAALQVQTQRALREHDPLKHSEALKAALTAVTRLRHVVQQILTLARSEPNTETILTMMPLDLAALARNEVEHWADRAVERCIDLGYEGPEHAVNINGETSLLRELIGNLLDNAIRYTGTGGTVTLRICETPPRLIVEDDGPGIPEDERQRVFERFYRLTSNTMEEGCGLGLSIAREIAARHEAHLTLTSAGDGRGTRAEIVFKDDREAMRQTVGGSQKPRACERTSA